MTIVRDDTTRCFASLVQLTDDPQGCDHDDDCTLLRAEQLCRCPMDAQNQTDTTVEIVGQWHAVSTLL